MTPAEFIAEFVDPSVALWREDTSSKVKSIGAILQMSILVDVIFNQLAHEGRAPFGRIGEYRRDLAQREPHIGLLSSASDAHKHGYLSNPDRDFANGVKQIRTRGTAFFAGVSFAGDFLGKTDTSLELNDGTLISVAEVLGSARVAWGRELVRQKLPPWP